MKKEGECVSINSKQYTLGEKIGGGTEGAVFDVLGLPQYVIKLLNDTRMRETEKIDVENRLKWIKDTIGNSEELKHKLAIPKALIDDDLGYIMVKANEHNKLESYLKYPEDEQEFTDLLNNYQLKKRYQIAAFMFNALEQIHISGLIFTDLSPNNIMVHNNKNNLVFIDTDNMRRKGDPYSGVLGTDGYMAPEIYKFFDSNIKEKGINKNAIPKNFRISVDSDIFSATIIAFQLITLNHPFIGDAIEKGTAEEETNARHCMTDYILHKNNSNERKENPFVGCFNDNVIVTNDVSELFYRCFVDGKDNPKLRPTAKEFDDAFNMAMDQIVKCPYCNQENLFFEEKDNKCWVCDKQIPDIFILKIFDEYEEDDRASLISKMTGGQYEKESLEGNNEIELSKVILEKNEPKFLYSRHFLKTNAKSKPFIVFTLIDEIKATIKIQVDSKVVDNALLIHKHNGNSVPIKEGREFPCNEYNICFEITDSRVGKIKSIGKFFRGGKEC
jgi:serine/threonine protein kinase